MTKTDKKSLKRRAVKHKETRADDCRFPKGSYKPASLLVFCTKGLPSLQYERPSRAALFQKFAVLLNDVRQTKPLFTLLVFDREMYMVNGVVCSSPNALHSLRAFAYYSTLP